MLFAGSLSDEVVARTRKPFQVADVLLGADLLRRAGVDTFLYVILGGPGETPATVEETLRQADRVRAPFTMLDHGYRIQPGTELREMAVAEGAIAADDDCFRATFYHSPATPPEMLAQRVKRYQAEHRRDQWRMMPWMTRLLWDKYRP